MNFVYEQIVSARSKMADHDFVSADKQLASLQNYAEENTVVVKPTLSEVLAKVEKRAFWDYVPGRAVRVEDVKEILSEYFA